MPGQPIDSGRMRLSAALSGADSTGRAAEHGSSRAALLSVLVQGPFQSLGPARLPRFSLLIDVSAAGAAQAVGARAHTAAFGAIYTGGQLFVELDGTRFLAPATATRALERGYRQAAGGRAAGAGASSAPSQPLGALGVDPSGWLTSPKLAGSATIAGEPTLHVIAGLDAGRFLADARTLLAHGGPLGLGAGSAAALLTPSRLSALSKSLRSARVDVFTGARDHRLRRLSVSASVVAGANARARAALDGMRVGRLTFVLEFTELDRPQRIAAPRDALPLGAALAYSESRLEVDAFELVLVVFVLVVQVVFRQRLAAGPVRELKTLHELVALVFVERGVVGDQHPLLAVELVGFEDLVIDLRRVVDDDHDLRLRVEVGARPERDLVQLESASVGHCAFIPDDATRVSTARARRAFARPRRRRPAAAGPAGRAVRCARAPTA